MFSSLQRTTLILFRPRSSTEFHHLRRLLTTSEHTNYFPISKDYNSKLPRIKGDLIDTTIYTGVQLFVFNHQITSTFHSFQAWSSAAFETTPLFFINRMLPHVCFQIALYIQFITPFVFTSRMNNNILTQSLKAIHLNVMNSQLLIDRH